MRRGFRWFAQILLICFIGAQSPPLAIQFGFVIGLKSNSNDRAASSLTIDLYMKFDALRGDLSK